jgi:CubicO group peptidase (beta-lactamase class C family)
MSDTSNFQDLSSQIVTLMERLRVPGVAIGLLHNDQEHYAGFGVTSIENPQSVTPDTLFQIGSITKTFVGTAVMRLVEQGKVDLDAPVKSYLPELKLADADATAHVTLRHLLTHTGGWTGDYFDDFGWGDDAIAKYVAAMAALPQLTPVGTIFHYNNAGFNLAGRVIEVVSGQPFEDAMQELVFDPLGLTMAFFYPWDAMLHRFVVGHVSPYVEEEPVYVATPWPLGRSSHPAGGVISTVRELIRYARFHISATGAVKDMQAPQLQTTLVGDQRGLTWMLRPVGSTRVIGHGGATKGQQATFWFHPETGFAIAMLTNSDRGSELYGEVTAAAFRAYLGAEAAQPKFISRTKEDLAEYLGRYRAPLNDLELSIREDGTLGLQNIPRGGFPKPDSPPGPAAPPTHLNFATPDLAYVADGPSKGATAEFLRNGDGSIAWLRMGGRVHKRQ